MSCPHPHHDTCKDGLAIDRAVSLIKARRIDLLSRAGTEQGWSAVVRANAGGASELSVADTVLLVLDHLQGNHTSACGGPLTTCWLCEAGAP